MGIFSFGKSIFDKYGIDVIEMVTQILEHEDEMLRLRSQLSRLREEAQAAVEKRIEAIQADMSKAVQELSLTPKQVSEIKRYLRKLQDDFERRDYGKGRV